MSADYNKIKMARQRILDSLEMELNMLASKLEMNKSMNFETQTFFENKKKALYQLNQQYNEDNDNLLETYNKQILTHLNSYIKDYGKKNSSLLIVGADNKGSILYGDESIDITEDLIAYVNERFKGEK